MARETSRSGQSPTPTLRVVLPPQMECRQNPPATLHPVTTKPTRRLPPEVLSDDEVCALMLACGRYAPTGLRNRALIALLYRAGLRINEALSLYPKDLDLTDGCIRVLNGKGGRSRTVGLDPGAAAVIARWLDARSRLGLALSLKECHDVTPYGTKSPCAAQSIRTFSHGSGDWNPASYTLNGSNPTSGSPQPFGRCPVFCTLRGHPMAAAYVRVMLKRLAARAGIDKRVHAHDLRHTHAAQLRAERVDIAIISRQLGHASITTTARYLDHIAPTAVIEAIRRRRWTGA